jgi:predicted TIM-barrel fold metal-dependent hydrolase
MKIFDFNIHLPNIKHTDVNVVIHQDMNLKVDDIFMAMELHNPFIKKSEGANFLLFNTDLFNLDTVNRFENSTQLDLKNNTLTALINFRRKDLYQYLEYVKAAGVKFLMVNSYLQKISETDFIDVYKVFKFAEENKMGICIDGSYGTSKMYQYDNLKLACYIADLITNTPIVIIHSGGLRIMESMLLAADKKNVWLDTSFSLPFYINSSLEQDYAFCYKKLDAKRIVYGSDYPYENSEEAVKIHLDFFHKYKFSSTDIEGVFYNNSKQLIGIE